MKKLIAILLISISCMSLTGCNKDKDKEINKYVDFEIIYSDYIFEYLFVDNMTGVLYYVHDDKCTPLYNADGTLKNIKDFE